MSIPKMQDGYTRERAWRSVPKWSTCAMPSYMRVGTFSGLGKERDCWDSRRAPKTPTMAGDSEDRLRESRGSCELLRTPFSGTSPYSPSTHPVNKGFSLASIVEEQLTLKASS